ncbi:MAG: hypothetical protein M3447_12400 [Acidobacteriota bacterium]|nr:hypothetical protein [Acidobacteriota bacterium]
MKLTFAACVIALLFSGNVTQAQESLAAFRYQPGKIVTGVVYHYLKTNIDGTDPEHVSIRIAAKDRIESFKFHPKGTRAGLVIATMDWSIFSVKRLESWQVYKEKEKVLAATLVYLPASKEVAVTLPFMNRLTEKVAIPFLPFHVYNFDFASLNFAFPHLVNPKKPFKIGVTDPTFRDEGPAFRYRGEVDITYVGDTVCGGLLCRKYRIDGPGLENKGGFIWVSERSNGYFQNVEIQLPDNPNWRTFKFELERVQRMNDAEWKSFMKAQF